MVGGGDDDGRKHARDRGDLGARGRRTESRLDGGAGDVLERECEEAEQNGGWHF
jgi:hypothetical protein